MDTPRSESATAATPLDLDAIEARASAVNVYVTIPTQIAALVADDIPDLVAEVRRLRARVAALATELDDTATELLEVDDVAPTRPPCPECKSGKHRNCDGFTWDEAADTLGACPCAQGGHP